LRKTQLQNMSIRVSWNYDADANRVFQKTGEIWIQWDACRPNARTTRRPATYGKTNTTINQAEPSTQWRPITISMQGANKLSISSMGRYHIRGDEAGINAT
jgi:hypothetical protein